MPGFTRHIIVKSNDYVFRCWKKKSSSITPSASLAIFRVPPCGSCAIQQCFTLVSRVSVKPPWGGKCFSAREERSLNFPMSSLTCRVLILKFVVCRTGRTRLRNEDTTRREERCLPRLVH